MTSTSAYSPCSCKSNLLKHKSDQFPPTQIPPKAFYLSLSKSRVLTSKGLTETEVIYLPFPHCMCVQPHLFLLIPAEPHWLLHISIALTYFIDRLCVALEYKLLGRIVLVCLIIAVSSAPRKMPDT